ncbi:MAG: dihydropteroate synthase [Coxiella sp. RIFCSPHIGHO2_12_FULL_42_15]|nr:MAG: dihydropteroate synthase [Coxiella sp. RIFCSPHIGHO2_12_FULL_42_15]
MPFQLHLKTGALLEFPHTAVMGIINVSPNSFFNPHHSIEAALKTAEHMVAAGVDILDIGGEATNPNINIAVDAPSLQEELDRVLPVLTAIRRRFEVLISVDTSQPMLMCEAAKLGADMINDQRALSAPGALAVVAEYKLPVCLMHFFKNTRIPGSSTRAELLHHIQCELRERVVACEAAGIKKERIILDPGFGGGNYGKNATENFYLLKELSQFIDMGFPVLVGLSHKSMLGEAVGGAEPSQRLYATIAADTLAAFAGVHILRGHDVRAMKEAIAVVQRVQLSRC